MLTSFTRDFLFLTRPSLRRTEHARAAVASYGTSASRRHEPFLSSFSPDTKSEDDLPKIHPCPSARLHSNAQDLGRPMRSSDGDHSDN
jgi:hypothetical protein